MAQQNQKVLWLICLLLIIMASNSTQLFAEKVNTKVENAPGISILLCSEELIRSVPNQLTALNAYSAQLHEQLNHSNAKMNDLQQTIMKLEQQIASQSSNMEKVLKMLEQMSETNKILSQKMENLTSRCKPALPKSNDQTLARAAAVENESVNTKDLPSSCAQAVKNAGKNAQSGVYTLHLPNSDLQPFQAYCLLDPNRATAWTVIQRRIDGHVNFYNSWQSYKHGFGDPNTEYFIGLDKLHALTKAQAQELWIEMRDVRNVSRSARYDRFAIGDEHEKYALHEIGGYSGNAGDSLSGHKGRRFTTKDNDNDDRFYGNCAVTFQGAWWYHSCHSSNLNGLYIPGPLSDKFYAQAIVWKGLHGLSEGLKYVHMAIRPRRNDHVTVTATDVSLKETKMTLQEFLATLKKNTNTPLSIQQ